MGGATVQQFGNPAEGNAITIESDGTIVVAGEVSRSRRSSQFAVVRYTKSGEVDSAFGRDGHVSTKFGIGRTTSFVTSIVSLSNGKVLAAGDGDGQMAFARYTANGGLDPRFGHDGKRRVLFAKAGSIVSGLVVQPDGKTVAAGTVFRRNPGDQLALVRLQGDGSLDHSFGGDGRVRTSLSGNVDARGVALQEDGKIVVVGIGDPTPGVRGSSLVVVRYLPNGSLDAGFGQGGVVRQIIGEDEPTGIAIAPDGGILLLTRDAVGRLTTDGSFDAEFGNQGWRGIGDGDFSALVIQSDGRIVLGGESIDCTFALWRVLPDGTMDDSFGDGGESTVPVPNHEFGVYRGLALQADGKILAAGTATATACGIDEAVAVARYLDT
ncbi:MAG: hypothetical protein ABR600_11515 [Actinomycetota bacterium]